VAIGIIAASPILFYHVWSFLSPALVPRERRAIVPALYLGLVLFAAGAALAYFAALPFTLRIMSQMQSATLVWMPTADNYFSFVVKLLLGFGVMFEMPVVIMVLTAVGLASSRFLAAKRRYAIAVMAILAAMITPGDVIVPTLILLGPLMLLYELSIVLARVVEKKRKLATEASENEILPEALT
jgi:sec-independent protein translocase protein TatC